MGRSKHLAPEQRGLWREERSSSLPKGTPAALVRKKVGPVKEERSEALEAELAQLDVAQGIRRWNRLGVYFKSSGSCVEAVGLTSAPPFPGTLADWIRPRAADIARIVNGR